MKKILSILLALVLIFTSGVIGFASGEDKGAAENKEIIKIEKVESDTPVIVVRGMNFAGGLQYDRGTENARPVNVKFDAGELFRYLTKTFATLVTTFSVDAAVSVICEYVVTLFADYPCDENGNSVYTNISAEWYPEAVENYPEAINRDATDEISLVASLADRYGADMVYYFVYDWRLDPMDNADLLNETVETALSDHGCEKVDIICCSMGGSITMAYLSEYGYENVDTVISNTSVMFGTDIITDLFRGKVCFEPDTLETFICASVPSLSGLIKFANLTGGFDVLCRIVNGFAKKYEEKIYDETLIPTFASLPGFWSMMQADYYEEARQFIFEGKEEQYAGLLTRLDAFYNNVASKREEILASAIDGGMKLVILACYNTPIAPVYEHAKYQSDGVVETSPMSGGAITSVVGSTLTDEQLAVGDSKYVSADKCINASTCLYRDYTWFMKNAGHVVGAYGSDCVYFLFELLESEEQPTINTWSKYPQSMLSDGNETLAPLT